MKITTLITAASSVTAIALAGEPVQPAPAPAPSLGGWFVGGTFGQFEADSNMADIANEYDPRGRGFDYLQYELGNEGDHDGRAIIPTGDYRIDDFEFDMYTLHIGRDLGVQFLGCDLAAYVEVGYISGDATMSIDANMYQSDGNWDSAGVDLDIIPITINLKAERMFFAGIKGYISAGIGYAFTDASFLGIDEDDGGFYAQASIGLAYDINEQWEIYGGARYLFLGDLEFGYEGAELDDSIGYEIGLRYSF